MSARRDHRAAATRAGGARANGGAKFIAGGQSLGPMLNLRLAQPELLVDITGIAELTRVEETATRSSLGACVTHADIEDGRVPDVDGRRDARRRARHRLPRGAQPRHDRRQPRATPIRRPTGCSCLAALGAERHRARPAARAQCRSSNS